VPTVLRSPDVTPTPRMSGRPARSPYRVRVPATLLGVLLGFPDVARAAEDPTGALPTVNDEPEAPPDAASTDADDRQRAMNAFHRGSESYNRADYQAALSDFLEAATLYASPDFQYNIGLCYEKLDKPEEAIAAFQTYLKTKRDVPDRANVEDRIARLREELERRANAPAPKPEPQPDGAPKQPPRDRSKPLVIAGAALTALGAAVALGGGIGLGLAAKRRSDDLDAVQTGGNPDDLTFGEAGDLEDEGKRLELGQLVTVAVGGAIALAGVALLAVGLSRRKQAKSGAGPRAALAPSFGRTAVGLSIAGRF
jgi:tetratricopeptide (TPR) repeat protein